MTTLQIIGICCLAYMGVAFALVAFRPRSIWKIGKIQAFVKVLGETGARIFIAVWGMLVGALGVYLYLYHGG